MKKLIFIFMQCLLQAGIAFSQNNWKGIGNFNSVVESLYPKLSSDKLYMGGGFRTINSDTIIGVVEYDGFNFDAMGCGMDWNCDTPVNVLSGFNAGVKDFIEYNGELYITGGFQYSNNKRLNGIAKWNGTDWDSIGSGLNGGGFNFKVIANELYVVGIFDSCAGVACNSIAKFDGINWSSVHNFPKFDNSDPNFLYDVEVYNNEIYVAGNFYDHNNMSGDLWRLTKFDGQNWVAVGNGIKGNQIPWKLLSNNGLLYVCGMFNQGQIPTNPGNGIAAYDGTNWINLGGGVQSYSSLPQVRDMKFYDNKLYVCGGFTKAGGVYADNIAYWDGNNWFSLDTNGTFDNVLNTINFFQDTLYVGGGFWTVNGDSITSVAKWLGGDYYEAFGNTTGIVNKTTKSNISVYPNPCSNTISIKGLLNQSSIEIYNTIGQLELKLDEITPSDINIEKLQNGLHYFKIYSNYNQLTNTGKFVKIIE
jgi:hypothetical protein